MDKKIKKVTESDFKMFFKVTLLGLKMNSAYPGLADFIEKEFKNKFGVELSEV